MEHTWLVETELEISILSSHHCHWLLLLVAIHAQQFILLHAKGWHDAQSLALQICWWLSSFQYSRGLSILHDPHAFPLLFQSTSTRFAIELHSSKLLTLLLFTNICWRGCYELLFVTLTERANFFLPMCANFFLLGRACWWIWWECLILMVSRVPLPIWIDQLNTFEQFCEFGFVFFDLRMFLFLYCLLLDNWHLLFEICLWLIKSVFLYLEGRLLGELWVFIWVQGIRVHLLLCWLHALLNGIIVGIVLILLAVGHSAWDIQTCGHITLLSHV